MNLIKVTTLVKAAIYEANENFEINLKVENREFNCMRIRKPMYLKIGTC